MLVAMLLSHNRKMEVFSQMFLPVQSSSNRGKLCTPPLNELPLVPVEATVPVTIAALMVVSAAAKVEDPLV